MGRISAIFGDHDANTLTQLQDVASRAKQVALMADGHLGYVMPIGAVAAYENAVSVVGVGFDIACGNAAIKTNMRIEELTVGDIDVPSLTANPHRTSTHPILRELADTINNTISFGIGRKNAADDAPVDDPLFLDPAWYAIPNTGCYRDDLMDKARRQLGTVGSGNHYVDVFVDEAGFLWVGVHFGSRGFGHTIATNFLAISQGGTWGDRGKEAEVLLPLDQPTGHDYFALMELAGRYAYAGREWVARQVVSLLGAKEVELVHNHHNFAWKERHWIEAGNDLNDGEVREVIVIRKGATPAFPGQRGFIGGSMGDAAVIVEGARLPVDNTPPTPLADPQIRTRLMQQRALYSTVHGAGRVMSRTQAAGKRNRRTGKLLSPGLISDAMQREWLAREGVILRGGGLDEAPQAYRRLPDVLAAQGDTINVLHTLKPIIVCMASAREVDPYKD